MSFSEKYQKIADRIEFDGTEHKHKQNLVYLKQFEEQLNILKAAPTPNQEEVDKATKLVEMFKKHVEETEQ
ncbi:UNVERIFIED_CONTAM: hypothetical protein RF648_18130 [Kocuria sp. CPCC 205274]|uniref:Uncharacterized protein n=1 Tax=Herbiconiux daphne TaxID=2970914 RepID=A0ABT2H9R2_9MICO|nr:hypothetical protein [Herbiconiux daphne]MCS5736616.1 hypothetical protein [Herbiconiux daphne]